MNRIEETTARETSSPAPSLCGHKADGRIALPPVQKGE
jgi:hypothetical protein